MKQYYILTYGCQMNTYDSHLMELLLEEHGYVQAGDIEHADVVIVNTCAVREHAVKRVLSRIDSLKTLKRKNPSLRLGIAGCVPQQLKARITKKRPFVDFILGPDNLKDVVMCAQGASGLFVDLNDTPLYSDLYPANGDFPEAYVSVMRGCINFCSYCIVPYTRGKDKSRRIHDIKREVEKLALKGYKRIVLLGQNVNNYDDHEKRLPHLLSEIAHINAIERIGFLTSHPAFFPIEVIDVMKEEPKIEKCIHLPLQSGSSKILRRMNRIYTKDHYRELINEIRTRIDDIALTTDIIVGFPGETEDDFSETMEMVNGIRFDSAYMFQYSPRRFTLASTYCSSIDTETRMRRLHELIRVQSEITRQKSNASRGRILDVLIIGENEKNYLESNAISVYNKRIVVQGRFESGTIRKVRIIDVKGWTPVGKPLQEHE
ncbi:MAG: tRNA (N6-isopentenyl adenosine(37)-C2)-methylthiotransferase MiaB [Candidatus Cloacimonadota bacterium]|nr:MAG: tRNA (N6-isopentenyl adenosine(37)-C2)-methylthiotransferase MiaB [Candidatus Cloacimonadota bacterium]